MASSQSHPDSYIAYAFTKKGGNLEKLSIPWKDPQPGEVVIKVLACAVCGSDEQVPAANLPIQYPRIPGHEIVGDVVAVPATEKLWKVGQRVGGGWHGGHCMTCSSCRKGDYVTCKNEDINGILRDGGYGEYCTLRSEAVVSVPEDMDPAATAPLLCAGVTCFNALRHMDVIPPEWVAIQGIGGLGHLGVQFAKAMGYRVVALSSGQSKEALARELGAHEYIDGSKVDQAEALLALGGAKVIMCTAPNAANIQKLLPGLAIDGTLLLIALEGAPITVSPIALLGKRNKIRGWVCGDARDSEDTLTFAQAHNIKVMFQKFSLDQAQEAYDHRSTARFRAVIVPGL
ncbi:GroES-like protein [Polyporus arcularius HHB13444]|uniref:GroES-like protein n=1 Tax=Polyporus arcularius HHB13444 TaxID=1314778 RepID=A0A5C3NVF4_9APHY|nr:GroES-like protein [Polyporus arcularius HHB13444]